MSLEVINMGKDFEIKGRNDMSLKNEIIINGEIHGLIESSNHDCDGCSLQKVCEENFVYNGICEIYENYKRNYKFINRGKVEDE